MRALLLLLAVDVRGLVLQVGDARLRHVAALADRHVEERLCDRGRVSLMLIRLDLNGLTGAAVHKKGIHKIFKTTQGRTGGQL